MIIIFKDSNPTVLHIINDEIHLWFYKTRLLFRRHVSSNKWVNSCNNLLTSKCTKKPTWLNTSHFQKGASYFLQQACASKWIVIMWVRNGICMKTPKSWIGKGICRVHQHMLLLMRLRLRLELWVRTKWICLLLHSCHLDSSRGSDVAWYSKWIMNFKWIWGWCSINRLLCSSIRSFII